MGARTWPAACRPFFVPFRQVPWRSPGPAVGPVYQQDCIHIHSGSDVEAWRGLPFPLLVSPSHPPRPWRVFFVPAPDAAPPIPRSAPGAALRHFPLRREKRSIAVYRVCLQCENKPAYILPSPACKPLPARCLQRAFFVLSPVTDHITAGMPAHADGGAQGRSATSGSLRAGHRHCPPRRGRRLSRRRRSRIHDILIVPLSSRARPP